MLNTPCSGPIQEGARTPSSACSASLWKKLAGEGARAPNLAPLESALTPCSISNEAARPVAPQPGCLPPSQHPIRGVILGERARLPQRGAPGAGFRPNRICLGAIVSDRNHVYQPPFGRGSREESNPGERLGCGTRRCGWRWFVRHLFLRPRRFECAL